MKHVLFISIDGLTEPLGQSQILAYVKGIAQAGYRFTIVSLEKDETFLPHHKSIEAFVNKHSIRWVPVKYIQSSSVKSKYLNNRNLKKAVFEEVMKNVDMVHGRSYPASIAGMKAAKKAGIPFIFDMRGFWADERIDGKIWDLKKPSHRLLYNYFKKQEKKLLEKSAAIVSLTQAAKNHLVKTYDKILNADKITVIPCCADLDHFNVDVKNNRSLIREKLGITSNQKVILYSGSIGTWYMLDEMCDFFNVYRSSNPDAVFLVLTQKDHELAHNTFKRKGIPEKNYRVTGAVREEVPAYIHAADAGLYFIKPAFSKMASSPVKLAEFMGCGLPVIANAGIGDIDLHAIQNNQVLLVKELNHEGYLKTVTALKNHLNQPDINRKFVLEHYSLAVGVERFISVYKKVPGA